MHDHAGISQYELLISFVMSTRVSTNERLNCTRMTHFMSCAQLRYLDEGTKLHKNIGHEKVVSNH